jgi:hypothetical protein
MINGSPTNLDTGHEDFTYRVLGEDYDQPLDKGKRLTDE